MKIKVLLAATCLFLVIVALSVYGVVHFQNGRVAPRVQAGPMQDDGGPSPPETETYTVEHTDYSPRPSALDELLVDDSIEDKHPKFDPSLIRPRTFEGWQVNLSAAVIRLDVPMIEADADGRLLALHSTYAAAVQAAAELAEGPDGILPSVNLIDGLAKQFDDGLYAALDQAFYQGLDRTLESHVSLVRRILEKVGPASAAAPALSAGLELAGQNAAVTDAAAQRLLLAQFLGDQILSKPIGFYTWNPTLVKCFRFLRFFQQPFTNPAAAGAIADALKSDADLLKDYERAVGFYARLTNPMKRGSVLDVVRSTGRSDASAVVAVLFPPSSSRETELFERLFPNGLPSNANLMKEFINRIRSGVVNLAPKPDSGWYDYQVFALETLLMPERGRESSKLLLTKFYKHRMLEAFQALATKRRETHVRQLAGAKTEAPMPLERLRVHPKLRLEPSLTYYLRTARSYGFLSDFLVQAIGEAGLTALHGLRRDGPRSPDLFTELRDMRDLFYGFYVVGCEDIGLSSELPDGEQFDRARSVALAEAWLDSGWKSDRDLATDVRVSVPIFRDPERDATRLWATLGVRRARLDARFVRGPRIRDGEDPDAEWIEPADSKLDGKVYLIPVDEFAEIELKGARVLTREELRAVCDARKTKSAIVQDLQR